MINRHLFKSPVESSFRPSFKTSFRPRDIVQELKVVSTSVNPFCVYHTPIMEHELKKYLRKKDISFRTVETSNPLKKFMNALNMNDRNMLEESLTKIKHLSFVGEIELEELETPTIIIRLSEMNREIEEKIFRIEYNLLKKLKTDIDFLVLPV